MQMYALGVACDACREGKCEKATVKKPLSAYIHKECTYK